VRLDGNSGSGAIVADLAGLAYVMRGKDSHLLRDVNHIGPQGVEQTLHRSLMRECCKIDEGVCRCSPLLLHSMDHACPLSHPQREKRRPARG
jgi:hypothetical protein